MTDEEWLALVGEIRTKTGWALEDCERAATTLRRESEEPEQ
jgi:hypothetical protein